MAVPLALVPVDGESVLFSAHQVGKCGILRGLGASQPGERVRVPLEREALLAWQRGLTKPSTPADDILGAIRVRFNETL